jgi:hypothetical protein
MKRIWIAAMAFLAVGCVHRPVFDTYRLRSAVLIPPGVAGGEVALRTLPAGVAGGKGSCAAQAPMLQLRKKRLTLTVDGAALAQQKQAGWLSEWTLKAERDGCIAPGEGALLAQRIVQAVPLDSVTVYRLLHPNDVQSGYVELGPENRLEVRSAISGAPIDTAAVTGSGAQLTVDLKPTAALAGFEIAWYALRPNAGRPGFHFEPLSADRTTRAGVERLAGPSTNFLQFPPEAGFYRLFYKTDDNGVTAIIIAGVTREDLDGRTKRVALDASACDLCITLPKRVGVNPFLVVTVNGTEVPVGIGGTVSHAIQAGGGQQPRSVLGTLAVSRPYAGGMRPVEFDRAAGDILNLKLNGGERITW